MGKGDQIIKPNPTSSVTSEDSPPYSVRILANLAQSGSWSGKNFTGKVSGENCNKLWHYIRALDRQGSGKVYLSIDIAAKFFEVTTKQIKRYLRSGLELKFFRSVVPIRTGVVLIYYSSAIVLAQKLGLESLGAIALAPINALKDLRRTATKITVLANQRASKFRQESKKLPGTILNPANALKPCGIASRGILFATRRYFIVRADTQLVGGSQKTAAKKLGRSTVTVNRHLINLNPTEKRQIAIADRWNYLEAGKNALEHKPNLGLFQLEYFRPFLKSYCSIYDLPEFELIPQKYLRRKLNIALKQCRIESERILQKNTSSEIFGV